MKTERSTKACYWGE